MNDKPKLLIFSVPSWNSKIGANTWTSILQNYPADKVAVLCIREAPTDSKACSRSFVISENKILKSIWNRNLRTGYEQCIGYINNNLNDLHVHQERYKRMKKHRSYAMLLARELVWLLGNWKILYIDHLCEFVRIAIERNISGCYHPQDRESINAICLIKSLATAHCLSRPPSYTLGKIVMLFSFLPLIKKVYGGVEYSHDSDDISESSYNSKSFNESIEAIFTL